MILIKNIDLLRSQIAEWRNAAERIAFVPTMGNLHQGHAELVRRAQHYADHVVVSIFVNPLQFGPDEDYSAYPRTFAADQQLLAALGTDLLFFPDANLLYPNGQEQQTRIEVPEIANILCGASRPGHFSGVVTIVCKLFNIVQPDTALFGEKDWQQLILIKRMVTDLNLPIEIIGISTVREFDGLAMSSRNSYLATAERQIAPTLYQALQKAAAQLRLGNAPSQVEQDIKADMIAAGFRPDYVSVRKKYDLNPATAEDEELIILAAAYLGRARLIDNIQV